MRLEMDKLKILVVDDESRMRKLVKDFLVRENYEVLEAGDGEEALDVFYKEKDIALILLDVMMQGDQGDLESADHHVDGKGRGRGRIKRIWTGRR